MRTQGTLAHQIESGREYSTMKVGQQQNKRKNAKILAVMLVFLLCGCNHRDTEYKLTDSISESRTENISGETEETASKETNSVKSTETVGSVSEKSTPSEAVPEETVQVYICGAVVSPGVYLLPAGSRVIQAVEASGGFLPDAEEKILNLARKIEDGEQITVWTREEAKELLKAQAPIQHAGDKTMPDSGSGKVNLNTAGKDELMTLSGIGESRAEAIIAYREAHGPFRAVEEIMNIEGIKEKMFEKIRGSIEV